MTARPLLCLHRELVFPFVLVLSLFLWFVFRDQQSASSGNPATSVPVRALVLTAGAVIVSYAFAVVVSYVLAHRREVAPSWARRFVAPSNATLAIFGTISLALGAYVVAGLLFDLPSWVDTVARGIGVVIGWPLLVVVFVTFALGNAVGGGLPLAVQSLFVAVGIALSTTWLFVLSGWLAAITTLGESVVPPK